MKKVQYILTVVLAIFIFLNLKMTMGFIVQGKKLLDSSDHFPGAPFLFLKPFLVHVFRAGYYADETPTDPDLNPVYARNFEAAQFALAPAILDHENPWNYDFVIVLLSRPQAMASIIKRWPSRVVVSNGYNIVLVRRIKS